MNKTWLAPSSLSRLDSSLVWEIAMCANYRTRHMVKDAQEINEPHAVEYIKKGVTLIPVAGNQRISWKRWHL